MHGSDGCGYVENVGRGLRCDGDEEKVRSESSYKPSLTPMPMEPMEERGRVKWKRSSHEDLGVCVLCLWERGVLVHLHTSYYF